jgi:hypothetical protein
MIDKRIISVVTRSGVPPIRLKCLDVRHAAPSQPVRLGAVAGARCRGHFGLFEPLRCRSLGQARVAGEPGKFSALIKIDPGVLSKTDPPTEFLSLDLQYISGMT